VLSITFQAHPLKGALRGHQSIHPHNDNTFSIVQLSLSLSIGHGAAPAARRPPPTSPPCLEEKKAYTNRQARINATARSKPRQPSI
jgi:hypothetical protein